MFFKLRVHSHLIRIALPLNYMSKSDANSLSKSINPECYGISYSYAFYEEGGRQEGVFHSPLSGTNRFNEEAWKSRAEIDQETGERFGKSR